MHLVLTVIITLFLSCSEGLVANIIGVYCGDSRYIHIRSICQSPVTPEPRCDEATRDAARAHGIRVTFNLTQIDLISRQLPINGQFVAILIGHIGDIPIKL